MYTYAYAKAIIVQIHCVERNGEAGLASCPIDFVSSTTPPLTPPSTENDTPDFRCRSGRLASQSAKRSYISIQGTTSSRASKSKRTKCAAVSEFSNSESANGEFANSESANSEPTIDDSLITESAVNKSDETGALTNDVHLLEGDLHTITHDDGMAILDRYFDCHVDSEPGDDVLAFVAMLGSGAEGVHPNLPLAEIQSNTSKSLAELQQPSDVGLSTTWLTSGPPVLLNPVQTLRLIMRETACRVQPYILL